MSRVTNGADLLVRCLENEGVKYIFGVPGEENLHILQSLKHSSICFVTVRNEQYAAIMAATYGHLVGRAGVALSTLGPGAANLVTGVAYAQMGGMPLVVLTGQKPIRKSKQAQFQILNLVELMRPLTKYTVCTESAERIPSIVREAFKRAEYEWPGAAHIEIPEDIAAEKVQREPLHRTPLQLLEAPLQNIVDCIGKLLSVKRPLLMLASGCLHRDIQPALQEFQNVFRLPFFTTSMAKGTLDERRPEYVGTPVVASGDYIHCLLEKTDCVIAVGYDIREKPPFNRMDGKQLEVIHINYTPADLDDLYVPTMEVIGELSHTLRAMAAMAECNQDLRSAIERDWADWREEARQAGEKIRQKVQDLAQSDSFPVLPQRFVADLRSVMPEDAILCLDIGMFALWLGRNYPVYQPGTFQLDKTLASMGTGVANGIVCKLVYPERKVVVVVGDGGLMMTAAGVLETAVSLGIHLVIIVVRDNAFGMIRYEQQMAELEDYAMDFSNPDLVLYAQSFGAQGHRVNSAAEFVPILNRCLFDQVKSGGEEAGGSAGSSRQFQENPPEHLSIHHSQHQQQQQHHQYRSSSSSQQGSVQGLRKGIVHVIDLPIDYSENKRLFVDAFKKGVKLD